jgi:hypothetical protein
VSDKRKHVDKVTLNVDEVDQFLQEHPHLKLKQDLSAPGPTPAAWGGTHLRHSVQELRESAPCKPFAIKEYPKGFVPYEHDEQVTFVDWLKAREIKHFAVPNGGGRSKREAARLIEEGVSAGVPDVVIPYARGPYHHGYCEMKRTKGGVVSASQRIWIDFLKAQGCCVWVAKGAMEAIEGFLRYWDLGPFDADAPK